MNILMINGSPRPNGNTAIALAEMKKIFDAEGAQITIIQVGNKDIRGCIGCGTCYEKGKCVFEGGSINSCGPPGRLHCHLRRT